MIRPQYYLYPAITPVQPRQAVTLILLRECGDGAGFEVLLSRRSSQARFVPDAFVFPGGAIDAGDALTLPLIQARNDQNEQDCLFAIAAIRESLEELGILLARDRDGQMVSSAQMAEAGVERMQPLAAQLQAQQWQLAADELYPFAHWVTDRDYPIRFDVPFLIAMAPPNQEAIADNQEQFDATWITPQEALRRHEQGGFLLVYPTIRSLEVLTRYSSAKAVLEACQQGPLIPKSSPRVGLWQGREERYMEHELPFDELRMVNPSGGHGHELAWQHEKPIGLLRHIQRLTAPNGGVMTGPGTNTYVIGEAQTGYIVMDPGPDDPEHLARIMIATGGDIRHIVCTHSHPDHSPGAQPLQALVQAHTAMLSQPLVPPILGMPSAATARPDSYFVPDQTMRTGDTVVLHGVDAQNNEAITHTLEAVFTPGHAANHLCFVLREDGLLFSGDHILSGTTTVILPPDGNMQAYFDSLAQLDAVCAAHDIDFMLPAHGFVVGDARAVIAKLVAHRLKREAKVLAAIDAKPQGGLDDWVAIAYADTPVALWPVARYSLWAHVERLAALHPEKGIQVPYLPGSTALPH